MDQDALRQRDERCSSSLPPVKHPWSSVADQQAPVPARAGGQASTACRTVARAGGQWKSIDCHGSPETTMSFNVKVTRLLCSPASGGGSFNVLGWRLPP